MNCFLRLLRLSPVLLALACGNNANTVASQPGAGSGGRAGSGGSGTGGTTGGGAGVGSGGTSENGGGGGTSGTSMGSGGTSGTGASSATGGTGSGGDPGGAGVGGSGEGGGIAGIGGTSGGGAGTSGEGGGGGDVSRSPCEENSDCIVRSQSCCGACGVATRDDVMALNREDAQLFATETCGQVACPGCAGQPDPTLVATCSDGFCAVVDILDHELTACSDVSDCRIRTIGCCECGGRTDPGYLISVSKNSALKYEELVCPSDFGCAACLPQYPATPLDCVNGHCQVVP